MSVQVVLSLPSQIADAFDIEDEDGRNKMMLLSFDIEDEDDRNMMLLLLRRAVSWLLFIQINTHVAPDGFSMMDSDPTRNE